MRAFRVAGILAGPMVVLVAAGLGQDRNRRLFAAAAQVRKALAAH